MFASTRVAQGLSQRCARCRHPSEHVGHGLSTWCWTFNIRCLDMLGRVPRGFDNDAGDLAIGAARCALCSTSWLMLDGHSRRAQLGDS